SPSSVPRRLGGQGAEQEMGGEGHGASIIPRHIATLGAEDGPQAAEEETMDWRQRYGDKLMSAAQAVGRIRSGNLVAIAPFSCTPYTLCQALLARALAGEIAGVRVDHPAALVAWTD